MVLAEKSSHQSIARDRSEVCEAAGLPWYSHRSTVDEAGRFGTLTQTVVAELLMPASTQWKSCEPVASTKRRSRPSASSCPASTSAEVFTVNTTE